MMIFDSTLKEVWSSLYICRSVRVSPFTHFWCYQCRGSLGKIIIIIFIIVIIIIIISTITIIIVFIIMNHDARLPLLCSALVSHLPSNHPQVNWWWWMVKMWQEDKSKYWFSNNPQLSKVKEALAALTRYHHNFTRNFTTTIIIIIIIFVITIIITFVITIIITATLWWLSHCSAWQASATRQLGKRRGRRSWPSWQGDINCGADHPDLDGSGGGGGEIPHSAPAKRCGHYDVSLCYGVSLLEHIFWSRWCFQEPWVEGCWTVADGFFREVAASHFPLQ